MIPLQAFKRYARYELIRAGLESAALPGLIGARPAVGGRGAIFTLHHVDPRVPARWAPNSWLKVTPAFLEQAIQVSLDSGLTPISVEDLPERLADRADKRRYVCFTLDDGYRDNARFAAPIFRRYGVPYTIFITAGFVERSRSIWWKTAEEIVGTVDRFSFDFPDGETDMRTETDLQKIAAFDRLAAFVTQAEDEDAAVAALDGLARECGIDALGITERQTMNAVELGELAQDPLARFGAHTLTHPNLRRVADDRLRRELTGSADAVARYVGVRPRAFAYPYGYAAAVGPREIAAARDAGFATAVTNLPGLIDERHVASPNAFRRVSLNGFYQKRRYVRALLSGLPFRLRAIAGAEPS
ncbi:polysaccharide deacetylase family protein [Nitratireductor pacificus]|uniref:Chitooligosaccharide deacetylase n=1 Tax=Nitratireductor pacificus pht-3B TaxID=391937 RepID=K2MYD0_9HYPH|nr:polysaccharide deacetylase family protein [Nitratireductor pacificus]EKF16988.1 polysaccharide deacetylase [Nitratireductor pacificus pht-3B]